ncbi:MAG: sigma-70 family RNA polymerase sigma factor [Verrucomicrobia bacterium]|nr:sigma-70 family RNA polymerase sigma factor [Verrucomicrobiota bacterium]
MHDDDDLKLLLGGKPEEQEQGLEALYETYSKPLWSFILRRFPGLRHEDVGEIVSDTFVATWQRIEDRSFDLNRPLRSFLFNVAKNKAIDRLRQYKARVDITIEADITEVADRIQGTEVGIQWRMASTRDRALTIQHAFLTFLRTLPGMQRTVAQVMADTFPEEMGQEETANEILARTGELPTVAGIKRARAEIRRKFKEYLAKHQI